MKDEYNLERFILAQEKDYKKALLEIKSGYKKSHWIWYIFPQLQELGYSDFAKFYGIKSKEEAKAYLENAYLRKHLIEIAQELYKLEDNITNILGYPDDLKVKSSMTLFHAIDPSIPIFDEILKKFYHGEKDQQTLALLKRKN